MKAETFLEGLSQSEREEFLKQLDLLIMWLKTAISGIFALEAINSMCGDGGFSDKLVEGLKLGNENLKNASANERNVFTGETMEDILQDKLQQAVGLINSMTGKQGELTLEGLQDILLKSGLSDIMTENQRLTKELAEVKKELAKAEDKIEIYNKENLRLLENSKDDEKNNKASINRADQDEIAFLLRGRAC